MSRAASPDGGLTTAGPDPAAAWQPFELGPGVLGLLTSRTGGVSTGPYASLNLSRSVGDDPAAVRRNRELIAVACGMPVPAMAWMHQARVRDGPDQGPGPPRRSRRPS